MKRRRQQELMLRARGGRRRGTGRKRARMRPSVPHRPRIEHKRAHPVHVTLRASRRLPSLREQVVFARVRRALGKTARSWFRIVHFSVQADHLHLLVEAHDKTSLSRGLMGAAIRLARAVNSVLRRKGEVWSDRFHARALQTPREVRNGLVYVLMNAKKHMPNAPNLDVCSSAASFTGWKGAPALGPPGAPGEHTVEPPRTWLLRTGWMRHGLIGASERPREQL